MGKIRVLIITGENNHDWKKTTQFLRNVLEKNDEFIVRVVEDPAILETKALEKYDLIILNYNRKERLSSREEEGLINYVKNGGGLVSIHASNNAFPDWEEYKKLLGGVWRTGSGHDPYGPFIVKIIDKNHPITKDMNDFEAIDELYHSLHLERDIHILATAKSKITKKYEPIVWIKNYGKGKVFHIVLGHDVEAMKNSNFIKLLIRGCKWVANRL